jgi:hypothetical protein
MFVIYDDNYFIFQMQVDIEIQNGLNFFLESLLVTSHSLSKYQSFIYLILKTGTLTSWSKGEKGRLMFSFSILNFNFLKKKIVENVFF